MTQQSLDKAPAKNKKRNPSQNDCRPNQSDDRLNQKDQDDDLSRQSLRRGPSMAKLQVIVDSAVAQ